MEAYVSIILWLQRGAPVRYYCYVCKHNSNNQDLQTVDRYIMLIYIYIYLFDGFINQHYNQPQNLLKFMGYVLTNIHLREGHYGATMIVWQVVFQVLLCQERVYLFLYILYIMIRMSIAFKYLLKHMWFIPGLLLLFQYEQHLFNA